MIIFGILGYFMKKFDYEAALLVLAFALGSVFEENLQQSLLISKGSLTIFFTHPISAAFTTVSLSLLVSPVILKLLKKRRPEVLVEGKDDY
jgi:putative tricarboxylic transport membrane protein